MTDNMALWDAVSKTDPNYTKHVGQRGGFTAISANYQIMQATKQFGPIGIGWGYDAELPFFHDNLLFVPVTLWHGDKSNRFGPMTGCEEWKSSKGHIDSDASKKATTDAITKLLSQLGFSADVFLGKYDDQKYVAALKKEFAENGDQPKREASLELISLTTAMAAIETTSALTAWLKMPTTVELRGELAADELLIFKAEYTNRKEALRLLETSNA